MSGPRATWKGALQISQVTIPIKVYPATETAAGLSFNQLHEVCQTRIQQRRWCATCDREVPTTEIVKGFEFETGRYVLLLDDELDAVRPLSARLIDVTQFAPADGLPLAAIDRAYFLAPDGPDDGPACVAYAVLADAIGDRFGIGKLAIYGREYLVAIRRDALGTLMLFTLHHDAERRQAPPIAAADLRSRAAEVRLADQVITTLTRPLDLADFRDEYQTDVRRLIDAKIAGDEFIAATPPAPPVPANLGDALRASLEAVMRARSRGRRRAS